MHFKITAAQFCGFYFEPHICNVGHGVFKPMIKGFRPTVTCIKPKKNKNIYFSKKHSLLQMEEM